VDELWAGPLWRQGGCGPEKTSEFRKKTSKKHPEKAMKRPERREWHGACTTEDNFAEPMSAL
jgi:hypothetical protein